MPLTPADVHNVTFSKPPIGKRGYKEDEVDVFLDLVGAELARLIETNNDLREKIERLGQQLRAAPTPCPETPRPVIRTPMRELDSSGGDRNVQAIQLLDLVQETADRSIREAEAEANGMLRKAQTKSEQLLSNAKAKASGMVNEARVRAETMLSDHWSEIRYASTEIVGAIACEKIALERKIDELHAFDREYRTQLQTYLNSQIQKLDGRGAAAPANPMCTQQGFVVHHFIPSISTTGLGSPEPVRTSVGNGSPDRAATDRPDAVGRRWQPAL
jgi:DivIVA domain-containing protein